MNQNTTYTECIACPAAKDRYGVFPLISRVANEAAFSPVAYVAPSLLLSYSML